ncbi:MAG: S8 family serine peptidase [Pseudomonadota bacterium]
MGSHFQVRTTGRSSGKVRFLSSPRTVCLATTLMMGLSSWGTAQAAPPAEWTKGRLLVETRAGLPDTELAVVLKPHGGQSRRIGASNLHIIDLPPGKSEQAVLSLLAHNPHLKFAELDAIVKPAFVPNDTYLGNEWHLTTIGATSAWDQTQGKTAGVTIAIIDSGVAPTHPDLAASLVPGWNFYNNSATTSDDFGHGTAVAGTAAAIMNNATGVAGVAGGAKIMPLRISDATGVTTWSALTQAVIYAADHGARVANISYGQLPSSSAMVSAGQYLKSKGGLLVVSAGNTGLNESYAPTTSMIPVSATESTDVIATWSSYGSFVALSAPGNNIWTTNRNGGYWQCWGTSFASPVTAGVVALMMAARPDLSNAQIESLLYATATDRGAAGRDIYYGYGRVNAAAAVSAAVAAVGSDTQAPSVSITSPTMGLGVSGVVAINASASDNVGVTRVELRANGNLVATDTASPFAFSWDSRTVANGSASLVASAFDAAGNTKASTAVAVNVSNAVAADITPPTVLISNPANGTQVSGSVSVNVSASDNAGSAGITQTLFIDGVLKATGVGASLSYNWNSRKESVGNHTIQAVARDAKGNTTTKTISVLR